MSGPAGLCAAAGGPVWLDATRLLTRIGRGALSGIDRVELAYLDHLLTHGSDADRLLVRSTRGYLLLPRAAGERLARMARGSEVPSRGDAISRLTGRGARPRHRAEAALRPLAVDRATRRGLARMLRRQGIGPALYLNIGHSNLSATTLGPIAGAAATRVAVFIHDIIPISHPALVPPTQPRTFADKLSTVRRCADLVICNSTDTAARLAEHWAGPGRIPEIAAVPLGLGLPPVSRPDLPREAGRFVMIGTIEPRKNHDLMLRVWTDLARKMPESALPQLHIIGARGWQGEEIAGRIASHPLAGRAIHLHGPLSDADVSAHLARADALLFPSLAEGFGLPAIEALAHGALPICSDLPALREALGDRAVYLDPADAYCWQETIKQRISGSLRGPARSSYGLPGWQEHFEHVARVIAGAATELGRKALDEGGTTLRPAP